MFHKIKYISSFYEPESIKDAKKFALLLEKEDEDAKYDVNYVASVPYALYYITFDNVTIFLKEKTKILVDETSQVTKIRTFKN